MSNTYYLHLKSGENQATCNQTIEASGFTERPSVHVRNVAAKVARQWGQGNGSKTVRLEVTDYAGNSLATQTVSVPAAEPQRPAVPARTIDRLAYAVRHGDQELFRELEAKWGIDKLECIAKLAEEDGSLTLDEFSHARFTFNW